MSKRFIFSVEFAPGFGGPQVCEVTHVSEDEARQVLAAEPRIRHAAKITLVKTLPVSSHPVVRWLPYNAVPSA